MVNAVPGRNLPVLNFVYHLPKPWTDWFAQVKDKQHTRMCFEVISSFWLKRTKRNISYHLPVSWFHNEGMRRQLPPGEEEDAKLLGHFH